MLMPWPTSCSGVKAVTKLSAGRSSDPSTVPASSHLILPAAFWAPATAAWVTPWRAYRHPKRGTASSEASKANQAAGRAQNAYGSAVDEARDLSEHLAQGIPDQPLHALA